MRSLHSYQKNQKENCKMLKIFAIGNLTSDVELRTSEPGGKPYAVMRLASDRRYKAQDGSRLTDFISVKVWGNMAERCAQMAGKGSKIAASGDFETVNLGEDSLPGFLIKASDVEILSAKKAGSSGQGRRTACAAGTGAVDGDTKAPDAGADS